MSLFEIRFLSARFVPQGGAPRVQKSQHIITQCLRSYRFETSADGCLTLLCKSIRGLSKV
jgi:hypothetical protein